MGEGEWERESGRMGGSEGVKKGERERGRGNEMTD